MPSKTIKVVKANNILSLHDFIYNKIYKNESFDNISNDIKISICGDEIVICNDDLKVVNKLHKIIDNIIKKRSEIVL